MITFLAAVAFVAVSGAFLVRSTKSESATARESKRTLRQQAPPRAFQAQHIEYVEFLRSEWTAELEHVKFSWLAGYSLNSTYLKALRRELKRIGADPVDESCPETAKQSA